MHLGSLVYYHEPLYNFHHVYGIIIWENEDIYKISIKKFKGNYLCVEKKKCKTINNPIIKFKQTFDILSNFKQWWFTRHKDIWQFILIETINHHYLPSFKAIAK